jgi:phosphopantetheine--protein transferase-like protein
MKKIIGCGIDIEELSRFEKHDPTHPDSRKFFDLIYSDEEIANNSLILPHLTFPLGFSCKEAFFKAFGVSWTNSPITWKDIELLFQDNSNLQQYSVRLSGYAKELFEQMNGRRFEASLEYSEEFVIFRVVLFSA